MSVKINEKQLNDLLLNTLSLVDKMPMTRKIKGVANFDLNSRSVSLNIYAISDTKKVRLLGASLKDSELEDIWDNLMDDYLNFGLENFEKYPDQMFLDINCDTGHFDVSFQYDVFHDNYSSLNESLLFDYHITNKVPDSIFIKEELNKALLFHNEKSV